jgi:peptidoglycan/LPS O-acetylase OafA/YrhL
MAKIRSQQRTPKDFLRHHALSIASVAIVLTWIALYCYADPKTHWGSFFGNAIADWTGVVATVIATKYFYEIGSSESKRPKRIFKNRFLEAVHDHSLSIFLVFTGIGWVYWFLRLDPEGKWAQVIGNIVSEWTQLLGLVLLTKKLIEDKSKESHGN